MNMSYFVQERWKEMDEQLTNYNYIKQAIKSLKTMYIEVSVNNENDIFQKIKLEFTISKSYLQLAASYSKFSMHLKAFKCAKKTIEYLNLLLNNLQNLLEEASLSLDLSFNHNSDNSKLINQNPNLKSNFLQFIYPTKKVLDAVETLIKSLETNNKNFPFNEKFEELIKLIGNESVSKIETLWIDEISISNFMHVEYINYPVISASLQFDELYSEGFLTFIVMLSSIVLFTVSTENRFLLLDSFGSAKNNTFKIKPIFEKTHQQRIRKMKKFIFSDRVHSIAISLLQHYLKENNLYIHLLNSYKKNYEHYKTLEEIVK